MLGLHGANQLAIATPSGPKMDLARSPNAVDGCVELPWEREAAKATRESIKSKNPYGFDIVVETTGSAKAFKDSINFV